MSWLNPDDLRDRLRVHAGPSLPHHSLLRYQRHAVFRDMAIGELRRGPLDRPRRRRLVQYAAMLGIPAVQAGALIGEARRAFERSLPEMDTAPQLKLAAPPQPWPLWVKACLAAAVIAALNATVVQWILW